ncbi:hypothetical protein FAM09_09230 [Niastella caeni]|uniref:Uncharacterized protein n=1 Tax=Niastella caeni TaxID=2569763 RepID=A0A4V4H1D6_9BACT|nr:hypothetical protein [Niastella caeni]THU40056.1 hypothetical protein FAM09_09230 [Niastella caeni]
MKYTVVVNKVIKEIIGLITIVLFIYTCTKIRAVSSHKRAAAYDTIETSTAVGFEWPAQTMGYHPLLPRHGLPAPYSKRAAGTGSADNWQPVTGSYPAYMYAGYQAGRVTAQ